MLKEPQRNLPVTSTTASGEGVELVSDCSSFTISLEVIDYYHSPKGYLEHLSAAALHL